MISSLRVTAMALWALWMVALGVVYMTFPPSPDQSQFDWMAYIATRGFPYYAGSFDMNWPGAMWLHEFGIRVFGVHAWTWRLTDFLLLTGTTVAGAVFLSRSGWRLAPFLFLALYPPVYVTAGWWMAGQRDIIAAGFLLAAAAYALPGSPREARGAVLAGVCVAAAVLIRPTYLSFLAGLILLEVLPLKQTRIRKLGAVERSLRFVAGFALGIGAAVVAGLVQGNLDDWYQQSVQFALSVYAGDPPQDWRVTLQILFIQSWHWMTVLAAVGLVLWGVRRGTDYAIALVLGIAATATLSFIVQDKGFGYHLGGVLPMLILLACVALDAVNRLRTTAASGTVRMASLLALCLMGLLTAAGAGKKLTGLAPGVALIASGSLGPQDGFGLRETERQEIIDMIHTGSPPDATVVVHGTNYEIAYRAGRLPPYRFINTVIDATTTGFAPFQDWLTEIETALIQSPPAFILIDRQHITGPAIAPRPVHPGRPVIAQLTGLVAAQYFPVFENDGLVVYQIRE